MRAYNFFASELKFTKKNFAPRVMACSWSLDFSDFRYMSIRSGDIRDQSLKLSEIAPIGAPAKF